MTSNLHPVNGSWYLYDPDDFPPPRGGEQLLLINAGGVLIIGPWNDTCIAWGYKPKIPDSVKVKVAARRAETISREEAFRRSQLDLLTEHLEGETT